MIKNRSFMIGLGSGLLIGALLLQLMNVGQSEGTVQNEGDTMTLSREQLEQQAEALRLKVVDPEDKRMTEEEWKQQMIDESAIPKGGGVKAPEVGEPAETPVKPDQPDQSQKQSTIKTEAEPPNEPKAPSPEVIQFQIKPGSNLQQVAEKLKQRGVINDSNRFIQQGRAQKMSTKILSGTYTFTAGEDYQSIMTKITTKPPR